MDKITVNAIGQQCPVPVVMTTKALNTIKEACVVEVHVDNEVAVQNVLRLAQSKNFGAVSQKTGENHFVITINGQPCEQTVHNADETATASSGAKTGSSNTIVVVSSDRMGEGNEELGKVLIKGFIYAVSQLDPLPKTVLFYNGGATIPTEGSASLEDLKKMEENGVEILTCGTCLDYYNLKDKLAAGSVTNMYTIVETMSKADRIIRP